MAQSSRLFFDNTVAFCWIIQEKTAKAELLAGMLEPKAW
jgi:hypothetical protein